MQSVIELEIHSFYYHNLAHLFEADCCEGRSNIITTSLEISLNKTNKTVLFWKRKGY